LFMRYVPGNVVDATTIKRTLLELKGLGIDVKFVTIPPAAAQMMTKASIPYFHID